MGLWNVQSVLNRGELDPLTLGRIDLQQYYNGVSLGQNVLAIPQGGLKKRPGTEYKSTTFGDGRCENFSFNTEQNYLLVFTNLKMEIFKDGVLQTNINGSGNDYLVTSYTLAQVKDFDYIQSADTIIITHPDVEPKKIVRTSDTAWTESALPLVNIPKFDFNDTLSPTPTAQIQRVTFTNATNGDRFKLSFEGLLTDEIVYNMDDNGASMAAVMIAELQALPNLANTGVDVANLTTSPVVFQFIFSFASAGDWDLLSTTPINTVNLNFTTTASIFQAGVGREEDVWSVLRGWPATCTFHEGRLWFGGSKSRPQTIWGSFVNDFFNFRTYRGLDDESVSATLDTDQVNSIQSIFSNRALQIFTTGGEFYVGKSPITPENIAVTPQTSLGSKRVRPVTIDGVTLFLQRTGKSLYQFLFVDEVKANQSSSISILAPHLIKDPIQMAVRRGTESSDANYIYIVNSDGTVTVFNSLFTESVAGFTRWETDGLIKSISVVDDKVYMLVEREINGSTVYYIEGESAINTDSAVITTGSDVTTITGLSHLEGETVKVKADGAVRSDDVVSSGQITISPGADLIEVGLWFKPIITTMPLNVPLQNGPNIAKKKKIMRASVQLYESNGIIINNQRLADKTIGINQFDAPEPFTGLKRIHLSGWSLTADLTITQDTPMDMTILNIGLEVKV